MTEPTSGPMQKNGAAASLSLGATNGPAGPYLAAANKEEVKEEDKIDYKCGCLCFYPRCLQRLAHPIGYLVSICAMVFVQSMVVSGYSSSILTTIENRYDLTSSEIGMIISGYDVSSLIAGLFVSYLGGQRHRTKWLGNAAVVIAVGSVGFTLPYFLGNTYYANIKPSDNATTEESKLCMGLSMTSVEDEDCSEKAPERWAWVTFILSFLVIGLGSSPLYSLGPTYLYDNVKPSKFPVYSSIMYSMGALGPATGFLLGGVFLTLWVDPGQTPAGLSDSDQAWVGAWWIGFLLCAGLVILISIPLHMFPIELPNIDKSDQIEDKPTFAGYGSQLREFPRALWRMLRNPCWLFVSLTYVVEQSIGTGFNRYIAKYFEVAFDLTAFTSSILAGCVLIPAAVFGIIAGGLLMKKLQLDLPGITKFMLLLNIIPCIGFAAILFLPCDNIELAGINTPHGVDNISRIAFVENLTSACNVGCGCSVEDYDPVCGSDLITYFNPCHAGCSQLYQETVEDSAKNYSGCVCVGEGETRATPGRCDTTGCGNLIPFLALLFAVVFVTTMGQNPVLLITLRSVDANSRSFSLGMQNLLIQLIAYIPTPIYFGQIFDSQCILWSPACDGTGACWEYNAKELTYLLFGTCIAMKGLTFLFLFLTLVSTRYVDNHKESYELGASSTETVSTVAESTGAISTISINFVPYSIDATAQAKQKS